jgi:N-acetylmuramic acid 6-phosphate (MurNAc-6-P) etherase
LVDVAVLFATLESPGLEIATLKVTVAGAAGNGTTGIRKVSSASGARVIVLVQVTVTPTVAPHDHPLSTKALVGPEILAGSVRTAVCTPEEVRFPTFETVIGI